MPIIATVGAANANSFGTLAEAVTYFSTQHPIPEKWVLAQSDERENALIQSALDMNELNYIGKKATDTQSMEWPRIIDEVYELVDDEFPFDDDEIPARIKQAQFEWALYHLASTSVSVAAAAGTVDTLKVGDSVTMTRTVGGSSAVSTSDVLVDSYNVPIKAARHLRGLRLPAILA